MSFHFFVGICTRICAVLIVGGLLGCRFTADLPPEVATQSKPAVSPSGNYTLVVLTGNDGGVDFQSFQILNQDGELVYASQDRYATRHTTYFLWDQDDRVWVYSGDLGTFFWQRNPDTGDWEKYVYADNDVPAPEFLKDKYPNLHNR